jgi:hypothetical protein
MVATLASNVYAGSISCAGTVDEVAYHAAGRLMIRLSSMNLPVFICSTDIEWVVPGGYSTSTAACKANYAAFLTAKVTRAPFNGVLFDGDQVPGACNAFTYWNNVSVRFYSF